MTEEVEKFRSVVKACEEDRGPFKLFGIFKRADTPDVWDVVASAPWLNENRLDGLRYLAAKLGEVFSDDEMLNLSRIIPMNTNDAALVQFVDWARSLPLPIMLVNSFFAGALVTEGYVLAISGGDIVAPHYTPTRL